MSTNEVLEKASGRPWWHEHLRIVGGGDRPADVAALAVYSGERDAAEARKALALAEGGQP